MFGALFALSRIQKIFGGGMIIALLVVGLWGWRVNSIRADLRDTLGGITSAAQVIEGKPVKDRDVVAFMYELQADRDRYKHQDELKKAALDSQSKSIDALGRTSQMQVDFSRSQRDAAEALVAGWHSQIAQAEKNAQRTQQLSDAEELKQCKEAMDAIYDLNF